MKIELVDQQVKGNVFIPVFEYEAPDNMDDASNELLLALLKRMKDEKEKVGSLQMVQDSEFQHLIVFEFGSVDKLDGEQVRKQGGNLYKHLKKNNITDIQIHYSEPNNCEDFTINLLEGLQLADYKFDKYKTKEQDAKKDYVLNDVFVFGHKGDDEDLKETLKEIEIRVEGNHITRDLVNEPANELTPKDLAKYVEALGEELEFDVDILKKDEIEDLGMEAYLSVARGAKSKPRLIVMRHFGAGEEAPILGLVGKGLTYDSGGYSIKPTTGMVNMKTDMGGAGAVIGAMASIVKAELPVNVVAVVAACENMISGDAYRPGDVIGSMAGKTIEVLNTDAEGRLTLADALTYIQRIENVDKVVDIATLTGAQVVALGGLRAGVLSSDDDFYGQLEESANETGEKIWRLPDDKEYAKLIESKIADMTNVAKEAGVITAGLFIKNFLEDERPWIHIDIAGPSSQKGEKHYYTEGATGYGARLLYELAKSEIKEA